MTISSIAPAMSPPAPATTLITGPGQGDNTNFSRLINHFLEQAAATQGQADHAVQDLALGNSDHVHNVLIKVAQADLTFRLILEIRNRLTEAMQEIMRMQV